ncbi:hypothetical protein VFPPC_10620 [Pochonia chlamydosporia 170]|uniref:Uncharacterized protein n=1 Tax=Pochonia chlamydosporia 170 TaxID=1380566 RepID=A0A179F457_METCM|nr:hypothetical protein VFPPC_10620 [Pochonia chlamydosporia 170]OAQ60192.2 hypothetical protein VFPPC_10620 [Pochonia chlamydosporia 170]
MVSNDEYVVLRGFPTIAVSARLAKRALVDSSGSSLDGVSLIFALQAVYPNGLFNIPIVPETGLAVLNVTGLFNMIMCNIVSKSGVTFSIGGPYSQQVQFAGGKQVALLSYTCHVMSHEKGTLVD